MVDVPRKTLLIVDDLPGNIAMLGENLGHDYEVLCALNGEQALRMAASTKVDLILLDILMPGMDGYDVCRQLKEDESTRNIPVIFITAKDEIEDEENGLNLGAVDYITKPFKIPILKARIRTHIDLRAKTEELQRLADRDGLTGIMNRRYFDQTLSKEWRRGTRTGLPISLALLDIDFFKKYNDHYGHLAGDACLRQVAASLNATANRAADLVARYGGEEFAILLPATDIEGAMELAERALASIRALGMEHQTSETAEIVTGSIGVASMVPDSSQQANTLIESADQALYKSKRLGRNRATRAVSENVKVSNVE